uniref:CREG-like beta-barrel domain-containing protein n=1 Tax=Brassica oleracea var. oleracea TaxID=109376 RepID=A0A0D3CHQ3_BRAOL
MEALSTSSSYISNPLPKTKHLFKSSHLPLVASSQSSYWLCKSPPKLRIRDGSSHGLRIQALLHNEGEGEDNLGESNGFGFFPGDIFSLSQEKLESETSHSVIDVESSLALPQGAGNSGGNRGGLFRTPISGGVQNATSAHALPRPALAVRNLLEQARFAHLCTVMSKMHHRREGYPFGSLVDFAPDRMGHPIFLFSPLAIHTRNLLAEPRCSLVVQIPGWSGLSNARVTLFGDVYPLSEDEQGRIGHCCSSMRFTSIRDDDGAEPPWRRRRRWLSDGFVVVRARSRLWRRSLARTEHDKTMSHLREPSRHWSRDVKKLSSGLETKKNESELKLVEVRSGLAKRVNEVVTS